MSKAEPSRVRETAEPRTNRARGRSETMTEPLDILALAAERVYAAAERLRALRCMQTKLAEALAHEDALSNHAQALSDFCRAQIVALTIEHSTNPVGEI